ncbi:bacteriocin [Streptococcus caviae]|uniref:hypothetical protein n=1 Tax=Streptococcus sp. 'caviae' TaxID=1915004 RepID=UPI00094B7C1A|nr:hypothetical protein [Streptococcus sp. 'caviae']OLN84079.1 hypothetical protein BMI76_02445 [Streptococcus sp. 'caviae']
MAFDNFEAADMAVLSDAEGEGLLLGLAGAAFEFIGGAAVGAGLGTVTVPVFGTVSGAGAVGASTGFACMMAGLSYDKCGPLI